MHPVTFVGTLLGLAALLGSPALATPEDPLTTRYRHAVERQRRLLQGWSEPAASSALAEPDGAPMDSYDETPLMQRLEAIGPPTPAPATPAAAQTRFDSSLDALVREGIVSPTERVRVHRGLLEPMNAQRREACASGALSQPECSGGLVLRGRSSLSPREDALLQQIRGTWRTYGTCRYDWSGWRLHAGGVRTTRVDCGLAGPQQIAVSCNRLQISTSTELGWGTWRTPDEGYDQTVAALCAHVLRAD